MKLKEKVGEMLVGAGIKFLAQGRGRTYMGEAVDKKSMTAERIREFGRTPTLHEELQKLEALRAMKSMRPLTQEQIDQEEAVFAEELKQEPGELLTPSQLNVYVDELRKAGVYPQQPDSGKAKATPKGAAAAASPEAKDENPVGTPVPKKEESSK